MQIVHLIVQGGALVVSKKVFPNPLVLGSCLPRDFERLRGSERVGLRGSE